MKKIFLLLTILALTGASAFAGVGNPSASPLKEKDLKYQIANELREKLNTPVYISYMNKDLKGLVSCKMSVSSNGKINITDVQSSNKTLNEYVTKKIKTLNAWTGTDYSGKSYSYTLNFK